jgi:2'-5' RNA ligase
MRLFVSLPIPEEVRPVLREAQEALTTALAGSELRLQDLERSHLTLAFRGEVPQGAVAGVRFAVDAAARTSHPFTLATGRFGAFPGQRRPSVLWLGVEGDIDELMRLQGALSRRLELPGQPAPENENEFRPHLTLARVRRLGAEQRRALAGLLASTAPVPPATWRVTSLQLMHSRLLPRGASHELLHAADLGHEGAG